MREAQPSKLRIGLSQQELTGSCYFGRAKPLSDADYSSLLGKYGERCQFPEMVNRAMADSKTLAAAAMLYRDDAKAVPIEFLRAASLYKPGVLRGLVSGSFEKLLGDYAVEVFVARDNSVSVRRLCEDVSVEITPCLGAASSELGFFDRHKVGPNDRFKLLNSGRILLEFSIELGSAVSKNYALLVGARSNLAGVDRDIPALRKVLTSRGFDERDVHSLYPSPTKRQVLDKLDEMARFIPDGSLTFFAFSGHGSTGGLCVGLFETISPKELYAALAKIRGNKFVLLDACHTLDANFLEGVPENTLVVTGQDKAKHVLYDAHVTRLFSLDGKDFASLYAGSKVTGGLLTAAFLRALEENAGAVDLKHVLPKVMEGYHRIASHNVEVHVEGKTVRMGHK